MANVNSYSFGSYRRDGSSCQHDLEVLHSVLCKVCCTNCTDFDVNRSLKDFFLEYPEASDIIAKFRDLLNISLH